MAVDYRTRQDGKTRSVEFTAFFQSALPDLIQRNLHFVLPWISHRNLTDIGFDCGGQQWNLSVAGDLLQCRPGACSTAVLVTLSADEFSDLINDYATPVTFYTGGALQLKHGQVGDFLDWWLVLRGLLDSRPVHIPGSMHFHDVGGAALNLKQSFTLDHPLEELRNFLETAGFLHLEGVFSAAEMAAVSADMDSYHDNYVEGDGNSWWATTRDGERRLVRMQAFDTYSSATAALLADPRMTFLGKISGVGHQHCSLPGNNIEALIKPLHVVQGISDLPWHKDCSLGRHSYDCCGLTVGVSVSGASADSGQLRVVAGSHRVLMWPALVRSTDQHGLPEIDLATRVGDVTVHLSCTMHMSQAPTERERRVLYTGFSLPSSGPGDEAKASLNKIGKVREGAYLKVTQ